MLVLVYISSESIFETASEVRDRLSQYVAISIFQYVAFGINEDQAGCRESCSDFYSGQRTSFPGPRVFSRKVFQPTHAQTPSHCIFRALKIR